MLRRILAGSSIWRAIAYPFKSLVMNPVALAGGLSRAKVLLGRDRASCPAFTPAESFLKLFYYIQSECLSMHGLRGTSKTMGGGELPMHVFWYQSIPGLWIYRHAGGAATVLAGMAIYLLSHLLWLTEATSAGYVIATVVLTACSTNFIGNLFAKQNYNVLAWALTPAIVWALATGNLALAAVAAIVIPPVSITGYLAFAFLATYVSVVSADVRWFLCTVPGALFFAGSLVFAHTKSLGDLGTTINRLLGALGAIPKAQFRRPPRAMSALIITAGLALFPFVVWFRHAALPYLAPAQTVGLAAIPVVWFFVNQSRLLRVADPQSILILFLAISAAISAYAHDPWILACFWLVNSNAFIALLHLAQSESWVAILEGLPSFRAFNVSPAVTAVEQFLSGIPASSRVLLACRDPEGDYNALFAEHFPLSELLNYAAHRRDLAIVPDFYSAAYAPDQLLWGTDPGRVESNLSKAGLEFAVVPSSQLEKDRAMSVWSAAGLELVGQLSFASLGSDIERMAASKGLASGWHLFHKPSGSDHDRVEMDGV